MLVHTAAAVAEVVIVGNGFTVKVNELPVLAQLFALVTVSVPV